MEKCPCGSDKNYEECCQPLIQGTENAKSAEALMRSRYTAYVKSEIDYIYETTHPDKREGVNKKEVTAWSQKSTWQSLEIVSTEEGGPDDTKGVVEFIARYRTKEKPTRHHEIAEFEKHEDRWYFMDGQPPVQTTIKRETPKVGRNDPCPCGSGKKFKKCCGA